MVNNGCGGDSSTDALAMRFLRERLEEPQNGLCTYIQTTYTYIYTCVHIDSCLEHESRNRSSALLQLLFELGKAPQNVYIPRGLTKKERWLRATRARGWAAQKIVLRHVSDRFLICSAWPYGHDQGTKPGPILLTKLQPDIRTLASHHHHHYHLPTTPPLPPFSLPPSSLPPPLFLSTAVNPAAQRQGQTPPLISLPGLSLLP